MAEDRFTDLVCPQCGSHKGRLVNPDDTRIRVVLIYACEVCGHLWKKAADGKGRC